MKRVFRTPGDGDAPSDVEREIDMHIELRTREFQAAGMSPEDARRAALEAFGDRETIARELARIRSETVVVKRRRDWWSEVRQDLTVGARVLRRSPSFAAVALLTLALGIGANTAIFGVLRSVLLRPLPYVRSEQLVQVWSDNRALGRAEPEWLSPPDYADWRDANTTFSAMAAYQGWAPDVTGSGDPESLTGLIVSGSFFNVLGAKPVAGRLFTMSDDDASAPRVAVISHAYWERRFGADPLIVGRRLILSGVDWTVIGVLAEGFRAPVGTTSTDIFAPTRRPSNARCGRGCIVLRVIGRLKPGVSVTGAQADLSRIAARIAREYPETNDKVGAWLVPLHEQITGKTKPALVALSAAVAFVLLIGCVNLANLLLVRGASRSRELGVRAALGAGRWRVIRQLLTENALLATIGGALGLAIGIAGTRVLGALVPDSVRQVQDIRVDGVVLAFAAGITVLAAALFGLVPALHAVRPSMMTTLRGITLGGRQGGRLRGALVVTQLSLAVVLLVSAGLLLRSFLVMQHVDIGYRADGLYLTTVRFPASRYPDGRRAMVAIEDLLTRLRANSAVRSAETTDVPPLTGGDQDISAIPVGMPETPNQPPSIWYRSVSLGYLQTMRMRLVAGRAFTAADRDGVPNVGIINQEAARWFWRGENPVGRVLATGREADAPRITIVGVVASSHHDGPNEPYKTEIFLPAAQFPSRGVTLVLEPARDVASMSAALRQVLRDVDPLVPLSTITPMAERVGNAVALPKLYATFVGVFAAAALLLAALGVYGVMAYVVTQRQREIGVRLALGAAPSGIRRMVLGQSGRLALLGLSIGIGGALLAGESLSKMLFGISRFDAPTLIAVPLVLGAVTLIASWMPARRAMRLDPLSAIREE
jgi:putative ABC transport system permease protein